MTCPPSLSICEKAAGSPYHCAEYCLRPSAIVSGSAKVALSAHSDSLRREGRPANRSRTEPVMTFCESLRLTPGAAGIFVFSILYSEKDDMLDGVGESCTCGVDRNWRSEAVDGAIEVREAADVTALGNVSNIVGGIRKDCIWVFLRDRELKEHDRIELVVQ